MQIPMLDTVFAAISVQNQYSITRGLCRLVTKEESYSESWKSACCLHLVSSISSATIQLDFILLEIWPAISLNNVCDGVTFLVHPQQLHAVLCWQML